MARIIDNPYDKLPLNDKNIINYLLSNELNMDNIQLGDIKELNIQPFLQKDFTELEQDCTFTSIVTCVHYFYPDINPQDIYNVAVGIYKRDFPSFQKIKGVVPFAIKHVYDEVFKYFKLHYFSIRSRYVNHIGFSHKFIRTEIDEGIPIILSMLNDGRKFYENHTVTVIGYSEFIMTREQNAFSSLNSEKIKTLALVYDNWSKEIRYIDLAHISPISCVVF